MEPVGKAQVGGVFLSGKHVERPHISSYHEWFWWKLSQRWTRYPSPRVFSWKLRSYKPTIGFIHPDTYYIYIYLYIDMTRTQPTTCGFQKAFVIKTHFDTPFLPDSYAAILDNICRPHYILSSFSGVMHFKRGVMIIGCGQDTHCPYESSTTWFM